MRTAMGLVRRALAWVVALVDDSLPMSPDERDQRDWTPLSSDDLAHRRQLRLKLHLLGKRGKGGYRYAAQHHERQDERV